MTTALDRPCTTCSAKPGEWCHDKRGRRGAHHQARLGKIVQASFSGSMHDAESRQRGANRRGGGQGGERENISSEKVVLVQDRVSQVD